MLDEQMSTRLFYSSIISGTIPTSLSSRHKLCLEEYRLRCLSSEPGYNQGSIESWVAAYIGSRKLR